MHRTPIQLHCIALSSEPRNLQIFQVVKIRISTFLFAIISAEPDRTSPSGASQDFLWLPPPTHAVLQYEIGYLLLMQIYNHGAVYALFVVGYCLALIAVAHIFGPAYYRLKLTSLYEVRPPRGKFWR